MADKIDILKGAVKKAGTSLKGGVKAGVDTMFGKGASSVLARDARNVAKAARSGASEANRVVGDAARSLGDATIRAREGLIGKPASDAITRTANSVNSAMGNAIKGIGWRSVNPNPIRVGKGAGSYTPDGSLKTGAVPKFNTRPKSPIVNPPMRSTNSEGIKTLGSNTPNRLKY